MSILTDHINLLGNFCGMRDLNDLSKKELEKNYEFSELKKDYAVREANPLYASK